MGGMKDYCQQRGEESFEDCKKSKQAVKERMEFCKMNEKDPECVRRGDFQRDATYAKMRKLCGGEEKEQTPLCGKMMKNQQVKERVDMTDMKGFMEMCKDLSKLDADKQGWCKKKLMAMKQMKKDDDMEDTSEDELRDYYTKCSMAKDDELDEDRKAR